MQARHLKISQLEAAAVHEAVDDHAAVDVGHHVLRAADDHDLAVAAAHVLRAAARAPVLRAAAAAAQGLVNPRTVQKLARSAHGAAAKTKNKEEKKREREREKERLKQEKLKEKELREAERKKQAETKKSERELAAVCSRVLSCTTPLKMKLQETLADQSAPEAPKHVHSEASKSMKELQKLESTASKFVRSEGKVIDAASKVILDSYQEVCAKAKRDQEALTDMIRTIAKHRKR